MSTYCNYWNKVSLVKSKIKQSKKIDSIGIGLASPEEIRRWGERRLPNGTLIGKVDKDHTVDYESLKPIEGGLFCERIFGPVEDFYCSCDRKGEKNEKFCPNCEVEFTKSRVRRVRMGYIPLAVPVVHVWYLRGRPSYIANLVGKNRNSIDRLAYGETLCESFIGFSSLKSIDKKEGFTNIEDATLVSHASQGKQIGSISLMPSQKFPAFSVTPQSISNSLRGNYYNPLTSSASPISTASLKGLASYSLPRYLCAKLRRGREALHSFGRKASKEEVRAFIPVFQTLTSFYREPSGAPSCFAKDTSEGSAKQGKGVTSSMLARGNRLPKLRRGILLLSIASRPKKKNSENKLTPLTKGFFSHTVVASTGSLKNISRSSLACEGCPSFSMQKAMVTSSMLVESMKQTYFTVVSNRNKISFLSRKGFRRYSKKRYISYVHPLMLFHTQEAARGVRPITNNELSTTLLTSFPSETKVTSPSLTPLGYSLRSNGFSWRSKVNVLPKDSSSLASQGQDVSEARRNYKKMLALPSKLILGGKQEGLEIKQRIFNTRPITRNDGFILASRPFLASQRTNIFDVKSKGEPAPKLNQIFEQKQKYLKFHTLPLFSTFVYKEWSHRFSFLEYFIWSARNNDLVLPFYAYQNSKSEKSRANLCESIRKSSLNLIKNKFSLRFSYKSNLSLNTAVFVPSLLCVRRKGNISIDYVNKSLAPLTPLGYPLQSKEGRAKRDVSYPSETKEVDVTFPNEIKDAKQEGFLSKDVTPRLGNKADKERFLQGLLLTSKMLVLCFRRTARKRIVSRPLLTSSMLTKDSKEKELKNKEGLFLLGVRNEGLQNRGVGELNIRAYTSSKKSQYPFLASKLLTPKKYKPLTNYTSLTKRSFWTFTGPVLSPSLVVRSKKKQLEGFASNIFDVSPKEEEQSTKMDTHQFPRLTELLNFTGGAALRRLLSRFDLVVLSKFLRHELKNVELKVNNLLALKMLTYSQGLLLGKLAKRRSKQIRRLKLLELFQSQKSHPEWMILSVIPVLPPDLRPILRVNDDFVVASDLNRLYQTVLRRNNTIHERLDDPLPCPESGLFRQRSLQKAVDGLLENGKGGGTPLCASKRRPLVSLSHVLKGKKGLFRQHLLGKRVDYSGRSVIVVGPRLQLHECGLPKEMAIELFQPFLLHRLKVKGIATSNTAARRMIQQGDPVIWHILKQLVYEHPVLLNRAPTLHRLGIQAFQPRLVSGRAILLHPLVCNGFNADFDGDQMAVHVPLSFQARAEAWKIMWSKNNFLSPATGQPILVPSQDMVLGCYYLSVSIPRILNANVIPPAFDSKDVQKREGFTDPLATRRVVGGVKQSRAFTSTNCFANILFSSSLRSYGIASQGRDIIPSETNLSVNAKQKGLARKEFIDKVDRLPVMSRGIQDTTKKETFGLLHTNNKFPANYLLQKHSLASQGELNIPSEVKGFPSFVNIEDVSEAKLTSPKLRVRRKDKMLAEQEKTDKSVISITCNKSSQRQSIFLNENKGHYFSNLQDSLLAYFQGRLQTHTPFWVRIDPVSFHPITPLLTNNVPLQHFTKSKFTCGPKPQLCKTLYSRFAYRARLERDFTPAITSTSASVLQPLYGSSREMCKTLFQNKSTKHFQVRVEANETLESPLELRLSVDGNLANILTMFQNHYNYNATWVKQCKEESIKYMRTTAGRVVINEAVFKNF